MNVVKLADAARALMPGEDDEYASDEYCVAEQALAVAVGHEDACSYTLHATNPEIIEHLEAVGRGDRKWCD